MNHSYCSSNLSNKESDMKAPKVPSASTTVDKSENENDKVQHPSRTSKYVRKFHESIKTWHLSLGHAMPVKAVRRHVQNGLLPHV